MRSLDGTDFPVNQKISVLKYDPLMLVNIWHGYVTVQSNSAVLVLELHLTISSLSVSRMLEKICREPQILVDIFVNYDCDLEAPNLFERMVRPV